MNKRFTHIRWMHPFLRILIIVALLGPMLAINPPLVHATNVCGPISSNTTWTLSGSPYIVTCNVQVGAGVTLTIQPGVQVKFDGNYILQIDGQLIAMGTSGSPITFTSNAGTPSGGDWGYILFTDTSVDASYDAGGNYVSGSIIQYTVIEYAGGALVSNDASLRVDASSPFIDHTTIRHNASAGIWVFNNGAPRMTYNTITDNGEYGITVDSNGVIEISHSVISNNGREGLSVGGGATTISDNTFVDNYMGVSIYSPTATFDHNVISGSHSGITIGGAVTITHNIIVDTSGAGVWIPGAAEATVSHNVIVGNIGGGGIYSVYNYQVATISYNSILNNVSAYGGVRIVHSNATDVISNTILYNNASRTNRGGVRILGHPNFNFNNVYNNTACDLYNSNAQGTADVNAENNWWGTADSAQIMTRIWDWFDDTAQGVVDYTPYLSSHNIDAPISPPTGLVAAPSGTSIALSWSPNPESDVAGYKVYYDTDSGFPYSGTGLNEGDSPIDMGNVTNFALTGLSPGTHYYISITAYDTDADGTDDQTGGNESWYSEVVVPQLNINKSAPSQVLPGGLLTYTIKVDETGGLADATGVVVTDTVPADTTCCASIGQGGTLAGNDVTWSSLTISKGQSISLTFVVTVGQVPSGTLITNDAYRVVTSTQGVNTGLGSAVTTTVQTGPPEVYLPVIWK